MTYDYDVVVVGSGFGGSVSALRLTEKGYRVGVLEAGARFDESSYPQTSWDLKHFLFAPAVGCYGIQRIDVLNDCLILSGAGVGGGSLVYANTLYEPPDAFYRDPSWRDITDWKSELAPYFDQAKRMLGVVTNPTMTPSDEVMKQVADELGVGGDVSADAGRGLLRLARYDGRRSVLRRRRAGADRMHRVRRMHDRLPAQRQEHAAEELPPPCRGSRRGGASADHRHRGAADAWRRLSGRGESDRQATSTQAAGAEAGPPRARRRMVFTAEQVVFSASALGTQRLLHAMRDDGVLPHLSARLGYLSRTNSESILGAIAHDAEADYSRGVAITSSFHPDEHTHVEPVRYGRGSNSMSLLQTVLTDGGDGVDRRKVWAQQMWRRAQLVAPALRLQALVASAP